MIGNVWAFVAGTVMGQGGLLLALTRPGIPKAPSGPGYNYTTLNTSAPPT